MRLKTALFLSLSLNALLFLVLSLLIIANPPKHKRYQNEKDALYFWATNNKERIKRQFGFDLDSPYIDGKEVLVVSRVDKEGVFDRAGIPRGSKLVDCTTVWLYLALELAHLKPVELEILLPNGNRQAVLIGGDT
jgi:hypothetical protein